MILRFKFTNDRGVGADGRYRIEQFHAQAFQKMFGKSHLSVEVKRIRFLKPDVAVGDVRWEMTGALTPDGTAAPNQTGLFALVFTTSGGPWVIPSCIPLISRPSQRRHGPTGRHSLPTPAWRPNCR